MPVSTRSSTTIKVKKKNEEAVLKKDNGNFSQRITRRQFKEIQLKNNNTNNSKVKNKDEKGYSNNSIKMASDTKVITSDHVNQEENDACTNKRNKLSADNEDLKHNIGGQQQQQQQKQTSKVEKSSVTTTVTSAITIPSPTTQLSKIKSISLRVHRDNSDINRKSGDTTESSDVITATSSSSNNCSNMPHKLLIVISNLYLNVRERLHLDFTPRCLDDLAYCHRHHYRSELPEAPTRNQAQALRGSLEQCRYVTSINTARNMCFRGEFPGAGIFKKLIELVLSINYNEKLQEQERGQQRQRQQKQQQQQQHKINNISHQCLRKCIDLFSTVVRTFPPCWHKMRCYYSDFLDRGLDLNKIFLTSKDEIPIKSTKIFDILLDLLEDLFKICTPSDLSDLANEFLRPSSTYPSRQGAVGVGIGNDNYSLDSSFSSECWNQNQYEEHERQKQTYAALKPAQRLERIFIALCLLLQILEHDLAMWMLHHNKNTKLWIFTDSGPLIVVLCELTKFTRMTRVARRIFTVFSQAVAKGLHKTRLAVLERYIALLMVASNIIDMEHTPIGVEYPVLSNQTKTLIKDFFEIFKEHNREDINKYIASIELLRIPFVRYEFIDNILFTNAEPLAPEKIAYDMAKKRWQNYKTSHELDQSTNEITREQYLHLLLDALRNYSDWHGLKTFWLAITNIDATTTLQPLTTTTDSVHRFPIQGSGVLVLKKLSKDIHKLEKKLRMQVRMSKPKVHLSLADICIDEKIIKKYRQDLKYILNLNSLLLKHKQIYKEVDFHEWLEFLKDFTTAPIAAAISKPDKHPYHENLNDMVQQLSKNTSMSAATITAATAET